MTELTPIGWAVRPLKRYAEFSGRAPRAEYWWYIFATTVVGFAVDWMDQLVSAPSFGLYGPLSLIFMIVLFIPGLAVNVRRLHDINRTGWWALLSMGWYAFAGWFAIQGADESAIEPSQTLPMIFALIGMLIGAVVMLVFTVTRGDQGPNRHGPDPYGPDRLEEVFA